MIGGGPACSFFSYFFLETASRVGLNAAVDIYEPKKYVQPGPAGRNMCGGIVSESLVQYLGTERINLPPDVVQRGSTRMCCTWMSDRCALTLPNTKSGSRSCIAAAALAARSYDAGEASTATLLGLAVAKGAHVIAERIETASHGRITSPGFYQAARADRL